MKPDRGNGDTRDINHSASGAPARPNMAVPAGNPARIDGLEDLTRGGVRRIGVGNPESVPAGRYAKRALHEKALWFALTSKLVYYPSVRHVLSALANRQVDAGFIYRTDAVLTGQSVVIVATIPLKPPVTYVAARAAASHAGSLWPALAAHIARTVATGQVTYAADEVVPEAWLRPYVPERLDREGLIALLASGSNYRAARAVGQFFFRPDEDFTEKDRAVGQFFFRPDEDFTDLLVACAPNMVFQHFALFPHRTVVENASFGLEIQGVPARQRRERAMTALTQVGLAGWEERRPDALSGGM